jgi:hypothetical protein
MRFHQRILMIVLCFALVPSAALVSNAQDSDSPADTPAQANSDNRPDAPARAARLQYMSGSVSVQPHGTDDWVSGTLNLPLTNADNIWADKNSRAEISVGTGLIRIDSETSLTLTDVDENTVQLQLHQGAMNLHVRRLYDSEKYEVDTPNQAFTVFKPGDYRFDVDSEADKTVITVWRGEGESTGDGPMVRIRANQQARFANGTSTADAELHEAPAFDSFDEWARSRDEHLDRSASARYVSPDVVGYEDLDEYGSWRNSPQYGPLWVPGGVGVGWAPYRYGHWIWVDPWGWTWVEDEPWGYAPFHYGRWVYSGGNWGWSPGPVYVRPYYAPALVAWFGGSGWGVSAGFGYGWCPLGYGEPYIPWYRASHAYFNQVNITNTHITNVNITNVYNHTYLNRPGSTLGAGLGFDGPRSNLRYANMHAPNGFTAVPRNTLLNSQSVARSALRVSPSQLSGLSPVRALDVRPTRTTMLSANAVRMAAAPPPRSFARPVVSHMAAPVAVRANAGMTARTALGAPVRPPNSAINDAGVQRTNLPNRGMGPWAPRTNMRAPESGSVSSRSVPRPPSAGGVNGTGLHSGNSPGSSIFRPPTGAGNDRTGTRAVRPQSVPRPAPSYQASNRGYGIGSYGRSQPNYGQGRSIPNYGGVYTRPVPRYGSETSSRPLPSYERGSYSRPMPSYGGAPGARSMPSYGGGSYGRSVPSYGSGSRAPSYGGGRSAGGLGGGHAASAGGGGHSSGGSHGGHH